MRPWLSVHAGIIKISDCSLISQARYESMNVDVVAGFEARGLIFGAPLALALGKAFVPLRKPGKLPGAKLSEEYITEWVEPGRPHPCAELHTCRKPCVPQEQCNEGSTRDCYSNPHTYITCWGNYMHISVLNTVLEEISTHNQG